MDFELYDSTKNINNYNYWNISKLEFELLKKHISNLEYFKFPTNNILDLVLKNRFNEKKKLLLNTEYEQDLKYVLELFKKYSSIKYKQNIVNIKDFFYNIFNVRIDEIFYLIDENNTNFQSLKENQDLFNINSKMIILQNNFEEVKKSIIIDSRNKNMKNILILSGNFLFNEEIIKNLINKKVSIPNNFTEFYLDYIFENTNYRYNTYVNKISSYNFNSSSLINLNSNDYNYYGVFPLLNKNINLKKETMIRKFNYMKNKYLLQTLLINLDRRQDRMKKFIENYGDIYPNFIRFSAIDGKNFDFTPYKDILDISEYNKYKNIKNPYPHHRYLKGVLGCTMSHYTIWKMICDNKAITDNDYILVLEDDIVLSNNFNVKLNDLLEYIHFDYDWDVVFLGFTDYKNVNDTRLNDMLIKFSGDLRLNGGGTFAYLIRKKGAQKYLDFAKKYKIQQAVDWYMIELFEKMTVYKCEPELVFSAVANNIQGADSDVQNLNEGFNFK